MPATAVDDQAEARAESTTRASLGREAARVAVWAGVLLGLYALYLLRSVLFLCLVALLLATAIEPLVLRLRRGPFSRGQGILIVYTAIVAVLAAIAAVIVPVLLAENSTFAETYPRMLENARQALSSIDDRLLGPTAERAVATATASPATTDEGGATAISVGLPLAAGLFAGVTVFVVAYYWLTERTGIKPAFTGLFPRRQRQFVGEVWNDVEGVLGGWVSGQLLLMLFIGVCAAVGYTPMGLKHALVLALIAGLLEVVPIVGPYLGAVPAVLVALPQDARLALAVAVYIFVIQTVEGNVLVPRVLEKTVGVSPRTVVLGLLVGATLGGVPGVLVAVPVAAALQVILQPLLAPDEEPPDALHDPGRADLVGAAPGRI